VKQKMNAEQLRTNARPLGREFIRFEKGEETMKRILPLSLIIIASLILAACGSSASREEVTTDFYSVGGAPMAPEAMPAESFAMPMATA